MSEQDEPPEPDDPKAPRRAKARPAPEIDPEALVLGRAVMARRAELGLRRKELAIKADISYPFLAELERGLKQPSAKTLSALAAALEMRPADLLAKADQLRDAAPDSVSPPEWVEAGETPLGRSTRGDRSWFRGNSFPTSGQPAAAGVVPPGGDLSSLPPDLADVVRRLVREELERAGAQPPGSPPAAAPTAAASPADVAIDRGDDIDPHVAELRFDLSTTDAAVMPADLDLDSAAERLRREPPTEGSAIDRILAARELLPTLPEIPEGAVRTAGIDLATEPGSTGVCLIDWITGDDGTVVGKVTVPEDDPDDDLLLAVLLTRGCVGVDAPFGWPLAFLDQITAWTSQQQWPGPGDSLDRRRRLAYRRTDVVARERMGRSPLSVSTDRIGLTAMRCAALLDSVGRVKGRPIDRAMGVDGIVEVWPAAALNAWGLPDRGYKGASGLAERARMLRELRKRGHLRVPPSAEEILNSDDDAFDALVAALGARAFQQGLTHLPLKRDFAAAQTEGWLHIPTEDSLERLAG